MAHFTGTAGDDIQVGTGGSDTFVYSQGGHDTLTGGGGGEDDYVFGGAFDAGDEVIGSSGTLDVVRLNGDYRAGVTLSPSQFIDVDRLELTAATPFRITLAEGVGGVGGQLFLDCSSTAQIDASQVSSTSIRLQIASNHHELFIGGAGDDIVTLTAPMTTMNRFDGGGGADELQLTGGAAVHLHAYNMRNFETLTMYGQVKTADGCVEAGAALTVRDYGGEPMSFDGGRERDGAFDILGGGGSDFLFGGRGGDTIGGGGGDDVIQGGRGGDELSGGAGADRFIYEAVGESGRRTFDAIADLDSGDAIDLSRIDARTDKTGDQAFRLVEQFAGHAGELTLAYHAKLGVTVLSGDVDGDGKADLVIHIDGDQTEFAGFVL